MTGVAWPEAAPPAGLPDEAFGVVIELPGVPRGKGRPRFARAGKFTRTYTPEETVSYERALAHVASLAMRGRPLFVGQLAVTMAATFPVPASWSQKKRAAALARDIRPTSKPDCDNILKCADALNGIVWRDDAQICSAQVFKLYGEKPGLTVVVAPVTA